MEKCGFFLKELCFFAKRRSFHIASPLNHFALWLLLDVVVLYAADALLHLSLRVAERVGHAEGESAQGHFDGLAVAEAIALAVALHFQVASFWESQHARQAEVEAVIQQRFGNVGGAQVEAAAQSSAFLWNLINS